MFSFGGSDDLLQIGQELRFRDVIELDCFGHGAKWRDLTPKTVGHVVGAEEIGRCGPFGQNRLNRQLGEGDFHQNCQVQRTFSRNSRKNSTF